MATMVVTILWMIWLCALACAVVAAYRRASSSKKSAVKFAVVIFGIVSSLCTVVGVNTIEWLTRDAETYAFLPLSVAISPLIGLIAVLRFTRRKNASVQRVERWLPLGVVCFAGLWSLSDVRATTFWWSRVDESSVVADVSKLVPVRDWSRNWELSSYLQAWPSGPQAERARDLHEKMLWHDVEYPMSPDEPRDPYSSGGTARFMASVVYLQTYPAGPHVERVIAGFKDADESNIESLVVGGKAPAVNSLVEDRVFEILSKRQTIRAYKRYTELYPGGKYVSQNQAAMDVLRQDVSKWEQAAHSSDVDAVKNFLGDYPGHVSTAQAQQRLDGLPLDQLVAEKLIEVELGGCGITSVCGRIRRLTEYPLVVTVPAGTLFTPGNASAQAMVITTPEKVFLQESGWSEVTIDAACADMWRAIPQDETKFSYSRTSQDRQLAQLEPALSAEGVSYPVAQAMVWIVRSNPTREQLRYHLTNAGGSVIQDADIDVALNLLKGAGYKIETRRARIR